jgi:hypothetical protein
MSYVLQNAIVSFSDVRRENIQKPMACDTTIYRGALKLYNNTGEAQIAKKVTVKVTTRHKWYFFNVFMVPCFINLY